MVRAAVGGTPHVLTILRSLASAYLALPSLLRRFSARVSDEPSKMPSHQKIERCVYVISYLYSAAWKTAAGFLHDYILSQTERIGPSRALSSPYPTGRQTKEKDNLDKGNNKGKRAAPPVPHNKGKK